MREERVTINILNWLEANGWKIICYDFPQSGTGRLIHSNSSGETRNKNEGAIVPDIIAVKDSVAVYFENKDRLVLSDFEKIKAIKNQGNYSQGIHALLKDFGVSNIYYGIGLPFLAKETTRALKLIEDIDFLICTEIEGEVLVIHDPYGIFRSY